MPVAPYDSDAYREWNRERMRRKRAEVDGFGLTGKYREYDRDYHRLYDHSLAGMLARNRRHAERSAIALSFVEFELRRAVEQFNATLSTTEP